MGIELRNSSSCRSCRQEARRTWSIPGSTTAALWAASTCSKCSVRRRLTVPALQACSATAAQHCTAHGAAIRPRFLSASSGQGRRQYQLAYTTAWLLHSHSPGSQQQQLQQLRLLVLGRAAGSSCMRSRQSHFSTAATRVCLAWTEGWWGLVLATSASCSLTARFSPAQLPMASCSPPRALPGRGQRPSLAAQVLTSVTRE